MVAFGFLGPIIGALGGILGKASKSAGDSRAQQNNAIALGNRNAIDLYGTQQNTSTQMYQTLQQALQQILAREEQSKLDRADLDLKQRSFALQAPGVKGKQALLGSLLQNLQPVQFSGLSPQLRAKMPTITGGLSPSALGPMARQAGGLMQQGAVRGLQAGEQFQPMPQTDFRSGLVDPSKYLLQSPTLQGMKQPGLLEKILGGAALGTSILGAIGGSFGGGGTAVNNQMPTPYTGRDAYGNPIGFQLPKAGFQNPYNTEDDDV